MEAHRPAPTIPSFEARCACAFAGIIAPTADLVLDLAGFGRCWPMAVPCCAIIAVGGPFALRWLATWSSELIGKGETFLVVVVLVSGAWGCLVAAGMHPVQAIATFPMVGIAAAICSAPFWASAAYAWLAGRLLLDAPAAQCGPALAMGVVSWLGGYLAAWRLALHEAHEVYASLPSTPPDCYVSTAAARGHLCIVQTRRVTTRNGATSPVNTQMQRLKCAELAPMALTPRAHRVCRRTCDTVGPPLAAALRRAILADAAYLLLKPTEWATIACLRALLPSVDELVSKTYAPAASEAATNVSTSIPAPFFAGQLCRAK